MTRSTAAALAMVAAVGASVGACKSTPRDAPLPVTEGVSARGLHYEVSGRGDSVPVVLIHAFQMDRREWNEIAPALAKQRRVVRYDVRGHGRTPAAESPYVNADDLLDLLRGLGIARADLVGLSMGSTIALELAVTHPEVVRRLVIVSPGIPGVRTTADMDWMTPIVDAIRARDTERAADLWWQSPYFYGTSDRGTAGAAYRAVVVDNGKVWLGNPALTRSLNPPVGRRLAEIKAPMLVVVGERDPYGSRAHADTLLAHVSGATIATIPGAGHMVSVARPAELLRAIEGFLLK